MKRLRQAPPLRRGGVGGATGIRAHAATAVLAVGEADARGVVVIAAGSEDHEAERAVQPPHRPGVTHFPLPQAPLAHSSSYVHASFFWTSGLQTFASGSHRMPSAHP